MCLDIEGVYTLATVADHIDPHKGDETSFWIGKLQSLCKSHHDREKKLIEAGKALPKGCDADGWPL